MATDKELLAEARTALAEMEAELERIASAGLSYGLVLAREGKDKLFVSVDGKVVAITNDGKAKPGEAVLVHPMTMQIVERPGKLPVGVPATVSRVSDLGLEIHGERGSYFICNPLNDLAKGDRILVDVTHTIALALIEKAPKPAFAPSVERVCWDDIGGHTEAKRLLREAVELPRQHAELFKRFGKKPTNGILLSGPPGCGKTLLARAVATSVGSSNGGFLAIKGPEVLDPYVGVTEQTIRAVFRQAHEYRQKHGREAVVFVDEAESLLAKRGAWANYMGQTVVPTFLTEMDGLEQSSAVVILATNRPDILDPAVIRDGRVDHKIEIQRPTQEDAKSIFGIYLKNKPMATRCSVTQLSEDAAEILYSVHNQHLPHSGAMIEGIVSKASSFAIHRAIADKRNLGLCQDDVLRAIEQTRLQEQGFVQ